MKETCRTALMRGWVWKEEEDGWKVKRERSKVKGRWKVKAARRIQVKDWGNDCSIAIWSWSQETRDGRKRIRMTKRDEEKIGREVESCWRKMRRKR